MAESMTQIRPGYYSVVRWAKDPGRDDAKNIAVIVVSADGMEGKIEAASLGQVLPKAVAKQGIVDGIIGGIEERLAQELPLTVEDLRNFDLGKAYSLQFTEPRSTAIVGSIDTCTKALFRALVKPDGGGGRGEVTSGRLLGRAEEALRAHNFPVRARTDWRGCHFDLIVESRQTIALSVISFATRARDWVPAEHHAGHYIYALRRTGLAGAAVVLPPLPDSTPAAHATHERVEAWFKESGVNMMDLEELRRVESPRDLVGAQSLE